MIKDNVAEVHACEVNFLYISFQPTKHTYIGKRPCHYPAFAVRDCIPTCISLSISSYSCDLHENPRRWHHLWRWSIAIISQETFKWMWKGKFYPGDCFESRWKMCMFVCLFQSYLIRKPNPIHQYYLNKVHQAKSIMIDSFFLLIRYLLYD